MPGAESVADVDVSGDGSIEGLGGSPPSVGSTSNTAGIHSFSESSAQIYPRSTSTLDATTKSKMKLPKECGDHLTNDVIGKIETHIGNVGKHFLFETLSDITIDDDKLRHTSRSFSDHGLQRTGFRGSRCGPVMNDAATVQSGLTYQYILAGKGYCATYS
jgi:hypothetical protein